MRSIILIEMAILMGGGLLIAKQTEPTWWDALLHSTRVAIAVIIVGGVLLVLDDAGAGNVAAAFGGLAVTGYLLSAGGTLGPAIQSAEASAFGSAPASPPVGVLPFNPLLGKPQ